MEKRTWKNIRRKSLYNFDDRGFWYRKGYGKENTQPNCDGGHDNEEEARDEEIEYLPPLKARRDDYIGSSVEGMEITNQEENVTVQEAQQAENGHNEVSLNCSSMSSQEVEQEAHLRILFNGLIKEIVETVGIESLSELADNEELFELFKEASREDNYVSYSMEQNTRAQIIEMQDRLERYQLEIKEWESLVESRPDPCIIKDPFHQYLTEEQHKILQDILGSSSEDEQSVTTHGTDLRLQAVDTKMKTLNAQLQQERDALRMNIDNYHKRHILPLLTVEETPRTLVHQFISDTRRVVNTPF